MDSARCRLELEFQTVTGDFRGPARGWRALRSGFERCRKDVMFYSDADLPFDFAEIARALRVMEINNADVVAGFRQTIGRIRALSWAT